jgi:hypothetical protein
LSSSASCTWSFAVLSSAFSSSNSCSFFKVEVPEIQHGLILTLLKVDFFYSSYGLQRLHDWSSFNVQGCTLHPFKAIMWHIMTVNPNLTTLKKLTSHWSWKSPVTSLPEVWQDEMLRVNLNLFSLYSYDLN